MSSKERFLRNTPTQHEPASAIGAEGLLCEEGCGGRSASGEAARQLDMSMTIAQSPREDPLRIDGSIC